MKYPVIDQKVFTDLSVICENNLYLQNYELRIVET